MEQLARMAQEQQGMNGDMQDRTSRSATAADGGHIPAALLPGATGTGPKVRYPTWDELTGLTPEQRRMVLEYFRRLNDFFFNVAAPPEIYTLSLHDALPI